MVSLADMVDNCAEIKPGMEVLILAHKDGLYGGDNLVDEEAVAWTSSVIQSRGAHCSILWIDEPQKVHEWRYPPIVKGAVAGADMLISTLFHIGTTEFGEFRKHLEDAGTWMVRMFPVTAPLLMSEWAQTPYELVSTIRHVSSNPFLKHMSKFVLTDPNGTCLEGYTLDPVQRPGIPGLPYNSFRKAVRRVAFWPEWVHPPINCKDISGVYFFNRMLSWWSRYIGIKPEWDEPIRIDVKDNRIDNISGGYEAAALRCFLESMVEKVGDGIWNFDTFHFGVHPNATIQDYQCPNVLHRRIINHSHISNLHVHIGSAPANANYGGYPHITGDIRRPTLTVGDTLVYDDGYLCCLDDPEVLKVAVKYPDRPGLPGRIPMKSVQ
jgi:hypothetical protein